MLLSAEHISINFGIKQLLQDVNFYLNENDKVGIIGINGTGKSTFLKVLAGVIPADQGQVTRNDILNDIDRARERNRNGSAKCRL